MSSFIRLLVFIAVIIGVYGVFIPLPSNISMEGERFMVPQSSITFLSDRTYADGNSNRQSDQEIFDEIFLMLDEAQNFILIDMFLFNDLLGAAPNAYRNLSSELTEKLITKKQSNPEIEIIFITDSINEIYGGYESAQLNELRSANIIVVITDLTKLRDSNPLISGFWRSYIQWFGNSTEGGWLPNPFDENAPKLTLRSYLSLFNFKANHRKVILTDSNNGTKMSTLVTSANPHDGSSAHTNTALRIDDALWKDVLKSEYAVLDFSGISRELPNTAMVFDREGEVIVQLLTEEKIRDAIVEKVDLLETNDSLDIAMFYLSDRKIIEALKRASERNASIRLLLDPNKDAFGREKNGIPNRPVAGELVKHGMSVRWCATQGEQCHSKMLLFKNDETYTMIQGSANLTRRNVGDYNLETNVLVESETLIPAFSDAYTYFNNAWDNVGGNTYTTDYDTYRDESKTKYVLYRIMEDFGLSTF